MSEDSKMRYEIAGGLGPKKGNGQRNKSLGNWGTMLIFAYKKFNHETGNACKWKVKLFGESPKDKDGARKK